MPLFRNLEFMINEVRLWFFPSASVLASPRQPTKRAPDKWESARFTSIFLASSFFCFQAESTPAHLRVTQTVGQQAEEINKMRTKVQRSDELSSIFLELGCQYYAIARYCASVFFMPICATMFHHAIEMLIKGYLIRVHSSPDLKKAGHNLEKLWSMYKSVTGDKDLTRFDKSISDLDRVELLRYPDEMVDKGFELSVRLGVIAPAQLSGLGSQPQYFVNVSDLDDIALSIFDTCKVNPKAGFKNTPTELMMALPPNFKSWE